VLITAQLHYTIQLTQTEQKMCKSCV